MSKNTAESTQTATVTAPKTEKKAKRPLFGLSAEELSIVCGGTGVIVTGQNPKR